MRALEKKINKVLEMKTDTPEMMKALGSLSSFYGPRGNTLEARRSLRADLEKRNLRLVREFIDSFGSIEKQLSDLDKSIESINSGCVDMLKRLEETEETTGAFLCANASLKNRREEKVKKMKLMKSFLDKFELSDRQLDALHNKPMHEGGGKTFFEALEVIETIRRDCQNLLATQYQRVGLDVLESISKHENKAFARLFEWVKRRVRASFSSPDPIVDPHLERAAKILCAVPSYRKLLGDLLAKSRSGAVEVMFQRALTSGSATGNGARPIEMRAHDPVRYAGDMLAWVHQCVASETDLIDLFFNASTRTNSTAKEKNVDKCENQEKDRMRESVELLDRVMSSVAPILRTRLKQIVSNSEDDPVLLYRLAELLRFYGVMTLEKKRLLSSEGPITVAVTKSSNEALESFESSLGRLREKLVQSPSSVSVDLSPPPLLLEVVGKMSEILKTQSTSPSTGSSRTEREASFLPTLTAFVQPLIEMCESVSKNEETSSRAIFMMNCLNEVQTALTSYDFVAHWVHRVVESIGSWSDTLARVHADAVLRKSGLDEKIRLISSSRPTGSLRNIKGLGTDEIRTAMRTFYTMISSSLPQFDRLRSPRLRAQARRSLCSALAQGHRVVYDAVTRPDAGYDDPKSILIHTPERLSTILEIN